MWTTIIGAIPWSAIFGLLLQLIMWVIDKQKDRDRLKTEFLKFISSVEKDIPVRMMEAYQDQIAEIRKQIELDKQQTK